jgi:hypothetical protein
LRVGAALTAPPPSSMVSGSAAMPTTAPYLCKTGEPLDPPADQPLAVYPVVIEDGRVLIEVPDGPLEISEG